ncbi:MULTISPECIES: 4-amino-4-deoxy-L-arabinose-phosphoundecaprenol flippase subunit ArnF [unclassified Pseudomonas]|uniref:4-amino-4-deoxy-L-arabinose-phosphoundecaprenol flippase subunit ArnF n=1 Tax=unclassified Pseudomonas TaxID=196821 RepID=UPI000D37D66B|nr:MULTISPECIES: 4-amino-4-deoxy-L-arabinose-phosphoundecaprenol flippase subunit ArnF [unclassified Pseudomonas]RAU48138.1 4-amino-4-deoxy-L-arabinose-phosphoundecaprenol flippase subunit ArnF [Pseudomonas sp. RIT 409]RAU55164.1 4-amino-4-deoxy-L-arabinose-phosphoundecaprenol flippase subunit ArnF [Pseudomonas sp. RIT 412]
MSLRQGLLLATSSVALVSAAQLAMRWSMLRLPSPTQWLDAVQAGRVDPVALAILAGAITAYGLSMLCWLGALRDMPLSRAYAWLSISYALVYLLAATLPFFNETLTVPRTVGVALIVLGVVTINFRRDLSHSAKECSR